MKKYRVTGRIRADIPIDEIVECEFERNAVKIAERKLYAKTGINAFNVLDDEIYCEEIKE